MRESATLWKPSAQMIQQSNLTKYSNWLLQDRGLEFESYQALWQWSVDHPGAFWKSILDYFQVSLHSPYEMVISPQSMPYTQWFEGATLNYAEHIFKQKDDTRPALAFASERHEMMFMSWQELEQQTASLQHFMREAGVQAGDRVAAYLPNIPEATVGLLATLSLGAVWSSCSPDFGSESVIERFRQIEPKILLAVDGYQYGGKPFDRLETVREISEKLPSVEKVVLVSYLHLQRRPGYLQNVVFWDHIVRQSSPPLSFEAVPFAHPIWVLYSSGTTGVPKAITHSHGGMLLEHLKYMSLHNDVHAGERFFWYTTTGWMMWNFVQASLLAGAIAVLYDGSPGYPNMDVLWKLAAGLPIEHFGTSAPYIMACQKAELSPKELFDLSSLRSIGSTGSPLPAEGFRWVYERVKPNVWLCSMSGGTDICTAWVGGNPWKPVREGEIQSRTLGCSMYAFDEEGLPVFDRVGEMVVTQPMPCMPIYFWNDRDYKRYEESYFEMFPGVWRHGDWVEIKADGGVVILGRSDTTLNRQGIRIGTAEIYRAVDRVEGIKDSLIVNLELPGGKDYMPLFVVLQDGQTLTPHLQMKIRQQLRTEYSPRHVPDEIVVAPDLPYTLSGKKMEAPVKRILMRQQLNKAANLGAMRNPESLEFFRDFAAKNPVWQSGD